MSEVHKVFAERFKEEMKRKNLSYRGLAAALNKPVEWLVTVVTGHLAMSESEAKTLCEKIDFTPKDIQSIDALIKPLPMGSVKTRNSRDPVIYRLYEVLGLYGDTINELLSEKGSYRVVDPGFTLTKFSREGDRINMVWLAKLLPTNRPGRLNEPSLARHGVFEILKRKKLEKELSWEIISNELEKSKEWTVAALMDRMTLGEREARKLCVMLDIDQNHYLKYLTTPPNRDHQGDTDIGLQFKDVSSEIPDSIISSLYKGVDTYAATIKEMILEDFGDGIMSAVNFKLRVNFLNDDQIEMFWSGKFLPYVSY